MLAAFSGDRYKSGERGAPPLERTRDRRPRRRPRIGRGRGTPRADSRRVVQHRAGPGERALERAHADRASPTGPQSSAKSAGLAVEVLDEHAIARLGMGLLLGVARGSAEPPRVIVLRHEPAGAPAAPVLGLVGKGITFDTGGISIKPADGMERMKDDMSGGAAVIGAMRAISLLKAPINVIGVVPATENMPGGRAIKPGDVLTRRRRQDGRGHQHGRRRTPGARRRPVVRARARGNPSRGCGHAYRRVCRRAWQGRFGAVRAA